MERMETIRNEVESDLLRWAGEHTAPADDRDDCAEPQTVLCAVRSHSTGEDGIRYQRCGGGVRIIRKQREGR